MNKVQSIIIVRPNHKVRLRNENDPNTYIYVFSDENGKLVIQGGSSIVSSIEGEGYQDKIKKEYTDNKDTNKENMLI